MLVLCSQLVSSASRGQNVIVMVASELLQVLNTVTVICLGQISAVLPELVTYII